MKAAFSMAFKGKEEAKKASIALAREMESEKGTITIAADGSFVNATVEADTFTGLRALSTAILRSSKIVYDVIERMESEGKEEK